MKKYEGLFILNIAGKEEGLKEVLDKVSETITAAKGKIGTIQRMEKRAFTRVADKKFNSGYYVNIIFEIEPDALAPLKSKLMLAEEVFRVVFTHAAPVPPPQQPAAAAA